MENTHITIRIPASLLDEIDREARESERSRAWVIRGRLHGWSGVNGVEGKVAKGIERGRRTHKPALSDVRKTEKSEKRLRKVHAVRSELASGGESQSQPKVEPGTISVECLLPGHTCFKNGDRWFCMTCFNMGQQ